MRRCVLLLGLLVATSARAFNDPAQFFARPDSPYRVLLDGNTDGVYATGIPRWGGVACASCHLDAPGIASLTISADVAALFRDGYEPGRTYDLTLAIEGESLGLMYASPTCTDGSDEDGYVQCNNNGVAIEIDDESGAPAGSLCAGTPVGGVCPAPDALHDDMIVAPDGDAALFARVPASSEARQRLRNGQARWQVHWTAPPVGRGKLTIYAAGLDGNGGAGTAERSADPFGDDAFSTHVDLSELGASTGCSAAPGRTTASPLMLVVLALLLLRARCAALFVLFAACNDNGPLMTPGQDCQPCHREFSASGTVFASPTALTSAGLESAIVVIVDADGRRQALTTNAAGNFYTSTPLRFPATVEVRAGAAVRHMEPLLDEGGCAHCHELPPQGGAQGRVFIPLGP